MVAGSITGSAASVVRRLTPGLAYMNNQLLTVSSEKERKLCSGGVRIPKGSASAGGSDKRNQPGHHRYPEQVHVSKPYRKDIPKTREWCFSWDREYGDGDCAEAYNGMG